MITKKVIGSVIYVTGIIIGLYLVHDQIKKYNKEMEDQIEYMDSKYPD